MNKEAMKQQIQEALSKKLGDGFHITIQKVFKPNRELDGLIIMTADEDISPTIYLEPFYKILEDGKPVDIAVNKILQEYNLAKSKAVCFDIKHMNDFDYVKDRLFIQLVNRHLNKKLLQNVPHAMFLDDFAVVVRCRIDEKEGGLASFLIHNRYLEMWDTDGETVLSQARRNMQETHDVDLMPVEQLIKILFPAFDGQPSDRRLWVMTNRMRSYGAATVLFDEVLEDFAREHGSFYVIFSSLHEALLILSPDGSDIDSYTKLNQDINATALEEDEVLGTKVYFYQKDRGFVL